MEMLCLEEMTNCDECTKCDGDDCFLVSQEVIDCQEHGDFLTILPLEVIFSDYIPYDYEFEW